MLSRFPFGKHLRKKVRRNPRMTTPPDYEKAARLPIEYGSTVYHIASGLRGKVDEIVRADEKIRYLVTLTNGTTVLIMGYGEIIRVPEE
jgi:hypothetical protein